MRFQKTSLYLSSQRIDRYLIATGYDKTKAVRLYKANLKIAQSFHPILGILEVVIRNRINTVLAMHFEDTDWIVNQKSGFMIHPSLNYVNKAGRSVINDFLKTSVEKTEKRFRRIGIPITSGKIIADQTLGFWTDLFEIHHYKILLGKPIQIFNHLPPTHGRTEICHRLNKIRQLRNRINHNEPICFNGSIIDFSYVEDVYTAIIEILNWIDPELIVWIKNIDSVQCKINNAKTIIEVAEQVEIIESGII